MIEFDLRESEGRSPDPVRLASQVIEYGGNAMLISVGGVMAWRSARLPQSGEEGFPRSDLLSAVLQEAHRQGLRVLVRLDVSRGSQDLYAERPDGFQTPCVRAVVCGGTTPLICPNGPYGQEHHLSVVREISSGYAADGFLFSCYYGHCTCASCRRAYREHTGMELPLVEDWSDPAYRAYVRYRYQRMVAYSRRLRDLIHERDPRVVFALDFRLSSDHPEDHCRAGWPGPLLAEQADLVALDAPNSLDRGLPRYTLWAGEEARLGRALPGNRPVSVLLTYSEVLASRRTAQPGAQLAHDLMQIAAHGGQPCVALPGTFTQDNRTALPAIRAVYRHLRDHAESYEDLRSTARVALLYSQTTMDFYGRGDSAGRCLAEYRGFYEALVQAHVQFDVLHDGALSREALTHYDLLILPNVAALSDALVALLDAYVEGGGHILASFETALYDEDGQPRPPEAAPALRCLGRRFVERREGLGSHLRLRKKGLLPGFEETDLLPLAGTFLVTVPSAADTPQVADLIVMAPVGSSAPEVASSGEEPGIPGLVLTGFGRGEAAYLPWQVGAFYHRYGVPEYRQLIFDLAERWSRASANTDAPGAVELAVYHPRGESGRALVHLLNAAGAQGKPLTEVIPLHGLSVWLRGDYRAARELRSDQDLPLSRERDGVRFSVPRLEGFAAVELVSEGYDLCEQAQ